MRKRFTGLLGGRSDVNEAHTDEAPTRIAADHAAPREPSEDYGEGPTRLHRPLHLLAHTDQEGGEDPTRPNLNRISDESAPTAAEAPTRPNERQSGARLRLGRQQILVAAHDGLLALDLSQTLQQAGYRVVGAATSAEEALELVAESGPDLAVIDMHLRGTLGAIDAAHEIQRCFGIPVILLMSGGDRASQAAALTFQPAALMRKPYHAADLQAAVAAAIQPPVYDDPLD